MGAFFGGPYNKDYSILGSILGPPYSTKSPFPEGMQGHIHSSSGCFSSVGKFDVGIIKNSALFRILNT